MDYCYSTESKPKKVNTNPRYSKFFQTHFTAGDEEQFQNHRNMTNGKLNIEEFTVNKEDEIDIWEKYKNLTTRSVDNTFNYIFHKFKKGIFIQIRNNKLNVFLPFSNINFINEWHENIKVEPKYGSVNAFLRHINNMQKRPFDERKVNRNINKWYGNGYLVRYEFPVGEGDSGVPMMHDMFQELCQSRKVPDIEFFVNRRDFPIIKKDGTEAYEGLFGNKHKLCSHSYETYSPILSMVTTKEHSDIPIPTWEDWARISNENDNKLFPKDYRSYKDEFVIPWENKLSIAVFRGASTGKGTTVKTNMRLKVAQLSFEQSKTSERILDAGITKWNLRPRKTEDNPYLSTIEINTLPFSLVNPLTPLEQSKYKYIINIDGHVSAFRFSYEMKMGCVILAVTSKYEMWFFRKLIPYTHFIPVKEDLSDLLDIITWCRNNDSKCKEIASNARQFYDKYLSKTSLLDYLQLILYILRKQTGTYIYNFGNIFTFQMKDEKKILKTFLNKKNIELTNTLILPEDMSRRYSLLKAISLVFNIIFKNKLVEKYFEYQDVFYINKNSKLLYYNFNNLPLLFKQNIENKMEVIHETFIGMTCINPLLKIIPNFRYIFGMYKDTEKRLNSVLEYFPDSMNFNDYLINIPFSFEEYTNIFSQICLALEVAQRRIGFVHNDLYPWNILLVNTNESINIEYPVSHDKVYELEVQKMPIIIDYGKSLAIYKGKSYGLGDQAFRRSTIQDVISLLVSSLSVIILNQTLNEYNIQKILYLANFMGNTGYAKRFKSLKELKAFCLEKRKYMNMLSDNKYILESCSPLSFFEYIQKEYNIKNKLYYMLDNKDKIQIFNSIIGNNIIQKNQKIIKNNNLFVDYYLLQNNQDPSEEEYIRIQQKKPKELTMSLMNISIPCISFKNKDFQDLESIERILKQIGQNAYFIQNKDLLNVLNMAESVFLNNTFPMKDEHRRFYLKNFESIFNLRNKIINLSTIETFKERVQQLIDINISEVKKREEKDEIVEKYLARCLAIKNL